jgi:hypothetical protein
LSIRPDQDQKRDGAEAVFKKKQERLKDGEQAMAQYEADRLAVLEKTARLRELRLARDAAAKQAPAPAVPPLHQGKSPPREKKRSA